MKVSAKAIKRRLDNRKGDRGRITLYLSKSLYKSFQKACGKHPASSVIEELMKDFVKC